MSEVKKIATRESYGNALVELGKEHENLVARSKLDTFKTCILTQVSAFSPPSQFPSGILKKTPPTQQRHCTGFSPVSISDPLISF